MQNNCKPVICLVVDHQSTSTETNHRAKYNWSDRIHLKLLLVWRKMKIGMFKQKYEIYWLVTLVLRVVNFLKYHCLIMLKGYVSVFSGLYTGFDLNYVNNGYMEVPLLQMSSPCNDHLFKHLLHCGLHMKLYWEIILAHGHEYWSFPCKRDISPIVE